MMNISEGEHLWRYSILKIGITAACLLFVSHLMSPHKFRRLVVLIMRLAPSIPSLLLSTGCTFIPSRGFQVPSFGLRPAWHLCSRCFAVTTSAMYPKYTDAMAILSALVPTNFLLQEQKLGATSTVTDLATRSSRAIQSGGAEHLDNQARL